MPLGCARSGPLAGSEGPLLVGAVRSPRLVLPGRMTAALARGAETFRICASTDFTAEVQKSHAGLDYSWNRTQAPYAVIGDFDGDDRFDVVVLQCTEAESRIAVVLDTLPAPRVIEVGRGPRMSGRWHGLSEYLAYVPSGAMTWSDFSEGVNDSTIWLEHAGFEVVLFEKAATTYVYENGRFREYVTGD